MAPRPRSPQKGGTANGAVSQHSFNDSAAFVVDDDASVRAALHRLLRSVGLATQVFASPAELLASELPDVARCLVLDIRLPGMSGLDLQAQLAQLNIRIPIIFMTGYGDIRMAVQAMKTGAVDFLTKPFRDQDMLDAVAAAITRDRALRDGERMATELHARLGTLSPREREVMTLVTAGLMNKQVAARAGLAEGTVKIYRGQVMRKMGAKSLVDLVRMGERLGLHQNESQHRSAIDVQRSPHARPSSDESKTLASEPPLASQPADSPPRRYRHKSAPE
jgi:FixJ family two-component response regulator